MLERLGLTKESVWDYPRPPRAEICESHVRVVFNDVIVASTDCAVRVLERSRAPVYYIPPDDVALDFLFPTGKARLCEWKGLASYMMLVVGKRRADNSVWTYERPNPGYEAIAGYLAFLPSRMDGCYVDEEQARLMDEYEFYRGWITSQIRLTP